MKYIISFDLGTGGTKASLFDESGISLASTFESCLTYYRQTDFREQKPADWWNMVCVTTKRLMESISGKIDINDIVALAVSGHSLGVTPIGYDNSLLCEYVPIWSDARSSKQAEEFFKKTDENNWYNKTGNGFPAPLYSVFKIMWYKENMPDVYKNAKTFLGTKDYVNFMLTGNACTDHSYASGSGVYDLQKKCYDKNYIEISGISYDKFPLIVESTHIVGTIKEEIAAKLGLPQTIKVACGGVDNACMAAGAGCVNEGEAYTSLGTSAWIAVASHKPVLDTVTRPYVFAHCVPGMNVSATAIFSAGNSFRWLKSILFGDVDTCEGTDVYKYMDTLAAQSKPGANGLLFNPSLAGGSSLDDSVNIRGGFTGFDLGHTRNDIIRSVLEGICLNLRIALDELKKHTELSSEMLLVGGGGKSQFWRQLFADIYNMDIIQSNVGEDAGSLGAAAIAAVGCGLWKDFNQVKHVHKIVNIKKPEIQNEETYNKLLNIFKEYAKYQAVLGDKMLSIK